MGLLPLVCIGYISVHNNINKFSNKNYETESIEKMYDSRCGLRLRRRGGAWRIADFYSLKKMIIFLSISINL